MSVRDAIPAPRELPSGWKIVALHEVTTKIGSGATPRGGESAYLPLRDKFALIRSQNVFDHRFETDGLAFISDKQAAELANAQVRSGDVLLNITGDGVTFARACLVPDDILPACVNQHVSIVRANPSLVAPGYLVAYLAHPSTKGYMESFNAGGSRRAITKGHIESFQLPLPPLNEQKHIGAMLGTIDKKIELNRRMNETIEAIARAIFKSWFVNFPTAHECHPAVLGEVSDAVKDQVRPDGVAADTPYIGLEHMPRNRIALDSWSMAAVVSSNKCRFRRGDILFGKLRPYFHKVGIAPVDGVCSTDILVIRPKAPDWFGFVLGHASSEELVSYADAGSTGTKMPRTSWNELGRFEIAQPPDEVAGRFNGIVAPLIDRIIHNIHESRTLATLRDVLLPKLISGEVRIKRAETRA